MTSKVLDFNKEKTLRFTKDRKKRGKAVVIACILVLHVLSLGPALSFTNFPSFIPLPSPITLVRTQSAFSVDTAENKQLTITYMIISRREEEVGEILLATTLEDGVTLVAADPTPNQKGQKLAFVLPSIPPSGEVTATLTVEFAPGSGPIMVDTGAHAFGNLRTRVVEAVLPPTTLQPTLTVGPEYLRSTIDANTTDRYVLRKTAEIGCDPIALFEFVQDEISYEVYRGSLRGARGTLWSQAGNSLDQASLLVAMLRACGIPSRYRAGTLDEPLAQELILSMFEPSSRVVGDLDPADIPALEDADSNDLLLYPMHYLPDAEKISDPANDPELLDEAEQHFWVEYYDGSTWVALDSTFAGAAVGDTFASGPPPLGIPDTFAEVPDSIRHKVRFRLDTEMLPLDIGQGFLKVAEGLDKIFNNEETNLKRFGSMVVVENTVLDQTFRTVELVGEPVSIGHFVDQSVLPGVVSATFNTYSPWMQVGDSDELIRGEDYEEVISSLGSNIVPGAFLRMTVIDPQGNEEEYERVLVDRIGFAIRQGEGGTVNLDSLGSLVFTDADIFSVYVLSSLQDERDFLSGISPTLDQQAALQTLAGKEDPASQAKLWSIGREFLVSTTQLIAKGFTLASSQSLQTFQRQLQTRAYLASPRLVVAEARTRQLDGTVSGPSLVIDLRKNDIRALAPPGIPQAMQVILKASWGLADTQLEAEVLEMFTDSPSLSILDVFREAREQRIPLAAIGLENLDDIDTLNLSHNARTRIREAVLSGFVVITPTCPVVINGESTFLWLETNPDSGEVVSADEYGGYSAAVVYAQLVKHISLSIITGYLDAINVPLPPIPYITAPGIPLELVDWFDVILWVMEHYIPIMKFSNPYYFIGFMIGKAALIWMMIAGVFEAMLADPILPTFPVDPEPLLPLTVSSVATTSLGTTASLPGGNSTGSIQVSFYRVQQAGLYPAALSGIGASGDLPGIIGSPNFTFTINLTLGAVTVNLDATAGSLTLGGTTFQAPLNVGFTGFQGSITGTDNGPTDTVSLDGSFERVLMLSLNSNEVTATQNTSISITPTIQSNADDTYMLTAEAPGGWNVEMADDGTTTITPAPGLIKGTYEIRFHAQSDTVPDLQAETRAFITVVPPDAPAVDVQIVPDTIFSVPHADTLVPTTYRIEVQNLSTTGDIFDISVSGLASEDFILAADSVFIGPGETGIVGIAFRPATGLLAPGTLISFTAIATGQTTGLTDSDSAEFFYPEVKGVQLSFDPTFVATTPDSIVNTELSLVSVANITETFTLTADSPDGLTVSGLHPSITLQTDETLTLSVTVTISPDIPVGTTLVVTVTADLCNDVPPESCSVPYPSQRYAQLVLMVTSSETICLQDSVAAALEADLNDIAVTLDKISVVLARLGADPENVFLQSRAITTGNTLMQQLVDANQYDLAVGFRDLLLEIESGDPERITAALEEICTLFAGFKDALTEINDKIAKEALHGFSMALLPQSAELEPGEGKEFILRLENQGTEPTTIDLTLSAVPAGVTASLNIDRVVLAPGEILDETSANPVIITLSQSLASTVIFPLHVTGTVVEEPTLIRTVSAHIAVRPALADVVAVTVDPLVVDPGESVAVQAHILNTANSTRSVLARVDVLDHTGAIVGTSTEVAVDLFPNDLFTVQLGHVSTDGLTNGLYKLRVSLLTTDKEPLPGHSGETLFFVGMPFSVTIRAEPEVVLPGNATITTSIDFTSLYPLLGKSGSAEKLIQFHTADAVVEDLSDFTGSTGDPEDTLGLPDGVSFGLGQNGVLVLDLGPDGNHVIDGPGEDFMIIDPDSDSFSYNVEVSLDGTSFYLLSRVGYGTCMFDLAGSGLDEARFVKIVDRNESRNRIDVDAVRVLNSKEGVHVEAVNFSMGGEGKDHFMWLTDWGIMATPIIGNIDDDPQPEILVLTNQFYDETPERLVVVDGLTGDVEFEIPAGPITLHSLALADICEDSPGPEIVFPTGDGHMKLLSSTGSELWDVPVADRQYLIHPIIANLDSDPEPEIVEKLSGTKVGVFNPDGTISWTYSVSEGLGAEGLGEAIAADIDMDGVAELIIAKLSLNPSIRAVHAPETSGPSATGKLMWEIELDPEHSSFLGYGSGLMAIADIDGSVGGDPEPEIIVGSELWLDEPGFVNIINHDGTFMKKIKFVGDTETPVYTFGAPIVADINGDGRTDIVITAQEGYIRRIYALSLTPETLLTPEEIIPADEVLLWSVTAEDPTDSPTGVSVYDLDGDGIWEVIWNGSGPNHPRTRGGLSIFSGLDGTLIYNNPRINSRSWHDYPAIADVDNDGHAELITGDQEGLWIIGADDLWIASRDIWNQHSYHITNINEDLSVPETEIPSWTDHNTYRTQRPPDALVNMLNIELQHRLPPTGYEIDPTSVSPVADEVSPTEVFWTAQWRFSDPAIMQFILKGQARNLKPGEIRKISLGSTVVVTFISGDDNPTQSGYFGTYYNLPYTHPDVESGITGVVTGLVQSSLPLALTPKGSTRIHQLDWYDTKYLSFSRVDNDLKFGSSWFPVDEGKPGDPRYFAVHWEATISVPSEGDYWFKMGSDDDSWLFIDGILELDLGGIHGLRFTEDYIHLTAGDHSLDIFFAERCRVESGFWFEFTTPGVEVKPPRDVITITVELPPVVIAVEHVLSLNPPVLTVSPGDDAVYNLEITNPLDTQQTFTLSTVGTEDLTVDTETSVTIGPGETVSQPLRIHVPLDEPDGERIFSVLAHTDTGLVDSVEGRLIILESANFGLGNVGVYVDLDPSLAPVGQGTSTDIKVIVTNTGDEILTFNLTPTLPPGITGSLRDQTLTVAPGHTASQETILTLLVPPGTPAGPHGFNVTAVSTSDLTITDTAEGTLMVSERGVIVELTPNTAELTASQTAIFQATITNTGTVEDTFNLTIGGPLAPFACLSSPSCPSPLPVTLAPGESQDVQVTISEFNTILQQHTLIIAQVTSVTDPEISATDASVIDILAFRDVTAQLEPTEVEIVSGKTGQYVLRITNRGNACDERYLMEFSSVPQGVTFTPQTMRFLVPPLKTAVILVDVTAANAGTYAVQVRVLTDTNNSLCPSLPAAEATAEATLIVVENNPPVVDAGADQTANEGDIIAFSGSFSDPDSPDTHTIEWDFGDGETATGTLTPTHAYGDNDDYTVTLTVTDDTGGVGTDTITIAVNNVPPAVEAGEDQTTYEGIATSFSGSFIDPGWLDTHTIEWDFGDGETATGTLTPTHVYSDYGVYTVTLIVTDDDGGVGTDTLRVAVIPPSKVTTSRLCYFDIDPTTEAQEFKLIFTRSPRNPGTYRLTASNPGQFYYNVFYIGTPGEWVTLEILIDDSFVMRGAVPVHVYSQLDIEDKCFIPSGELTDFTIIVDQLSITVAGQVPETGLVYVTVHLDYGLKKTAGYGKDPDNNAIDPKTGTILIQNLGSYSFSCKVNDTDMDTESIQNVNVFKGKDTLGFTGMITNNNLVQGVRVQIYDPVDSPTSIFYACEDDWHFSRSNASNKFPLQKTSLLEYHILDLVDSFSFLQQQYFHLSQPIWILLQTPSVFSLLPL